jgi:hypothetical protein
MQLDLQFRTKPVQPIIFRQRATHARAGEILMMHVSVAMGTRQQAATKNHSSQHGAAPSQRQIHSVFVWSKTIRKTKKERKKTVGDLSI